MFAGVEGDEFDAGGAAKDVDGADAVAVDAGGMGEEAETFPPDGGKTVGLKRVDAEHHTGRGIGARRGEVDAGRRIGGRGGGAGRRGGGSGGATEEAEGGRREGDEESDGRNALGDGHELRYRCVGCSGRRAGR